MSDYRIIYTATEGNVCVIVPAPGIPQEEAMKALPAGVEHEVVNVAEVPSDRTFRNAWKRGEQGKKIGVDMGKAKDLTHDKRRAKRAEEFAPHDEVIAKQIPGKDAQEAEAARAAIRAKYDTMQIAINTASTPEALKAIIDSEGL